MVLPRFGLINLSEDCRRVTCCFHPPSYDEAGNCYRAGKRKLSSWKNANRHFSIFRRSEPACASTEVSCGEFVANLRRPRPDGLKAVVAHFWTPWLEAPSPSNISALARRCPAHFPPLDAGDKWHVIAADRRDDLELGSRRLMGFSKGRRWKSSTFFVLRVT